MGRYNIAYIPKFRTNEFIKLAMDNMKQPHTYMLSEHSIPHITICQFHCDEDKLEDLCEQIYSQQLDYHLELSFKDISHISFNQPIYWLSLLPENTSKLHEMFEQISKCVTSLRTDDYDPHLTLFNYTLTEQQKLEGFSNIMSEKIRIEDEFELILGECDSVGQLTKIIKVLTDADKPSLNTIKV